MRIVVAAALTAFLAAGQSPDLSRDAKAFSEMIAAAPHLPLTKTRVVPQPPRDGWKIGYPSSVAMSRDGVIYILQRDDTADPVIAIDATGRVLRSWGKGLFKIPHSIRVDAKGNVWTVDAQSSMIYKFSPQGEKLMEIAVGGQPEGKTGFAGTTDIAFGPNGHLFVSDGYGNARILEYSPAGKLVREWGSPGTGSGQFRQPHGIAIDDKGTIYVADRQNGRLQRFDLTGRYLGEWNHVGMVTGVTFRNGSIWIGTQQRNEPTSSDGWILKLDRGSGKVLGAIESSRAHHVLDVSAKGEVLSGARPDVVWWFRTR